jgi:hypothetical protein
LRWLGFLAVGCVSLLMTVWAVAALHFDVRHYDQTFDLDRIRTAELYMVYWGSPNMAHTMMSFGFEGGDYLCFSIETRKEQGEEAYLFRLNATPAQVREFFLNYIHRLNELRQRREWYSAITC